jgi:hypothetical protein
VFAVVAATAVPTVLSVAASAFKDAKKGSSHEAFDYAVVAVRASAKSSHRDSILGFN